MGKEVGYKIRLALKMVQYHTGPYADFLKGGSELKGFYKGGANLKIILILRPN